MASRSPLRQCPRCARHVHARDRACPFCRSGLSLVAATLIIGCGAATGLPLHDDAGDGTDASTSDAPEADALASDDAASLDVTGFDVARRPDASQPDGRVFDGPVPPYGSPPRFDAGRVPDKDE